MAMERAQMDIARLVAEHHQPVFRYAYRLTGSVPEAEDLTQEVFLTAQKRISQLRQPEKVQAWLFRILRNCFLKSRQRRARRPLALTDLALDANLLPAQTPAADQIDRRELQEALNQLPDQARVILTMFYFENLSYREIAEELEVPIGTVMSRLSRAKGHLRRRLLAPSAHRRPAPVPKG